MLVQKRNFTKYCEILQYLITILENPLIIVQHYEEEAEKGAALHVMQDPQACKENIKGRSDSASSWGVSQGVPLSVGAPQVSSTAIIPPNCFNM